MIFFQQKLKTLHIFYHYGSLRIDITDSYGLRIFLEFSKIDVTNHYVLRKVKKVKKKGHYVFCNFEKRKHYGKRKRNPYGNTQP